MDDPSTENATRSSGLWASGACGYDGLQQVRGRPIHTMAAPASALMPVTKTALWGRYQFVVAARKRRRHACTSPHIIIFSANRRRIVRLSRKCCLFSTSRSEKATSTQLYVQTPVSCLSRRFPRLRVASGKHWCLPRGLADSAIIVFLLALTRDMADTYAHEKKNLACGRILARKLRIKSMVVCALRTVR